MKEYRTVDKSEWRDGPWKREPDKMSWTDEVTGFPCLIVRNEIGALCGYVGVPEQHPWYEKHYDAIDNPYPDVHGGLTYSDHCQEGSTEDKGICHVSEGDDKVWWLGFDCCHLNDFTDMKGLLRYFKLEGVREFRKNDIYRDVEYVRGEVRKLAKQAKDAAHANTF